MKFESRRTFLQTAAAAGMLAQSAFPVLGANDRINLAVVGIGGRGRDHINEFARQAQCRIAAVCDIDQAGRERGVAQVEKLLGYKPKQYADMRQLFEDKDVDAVTFATPNHWHALGTIWACQAGKDVYVEKPPSHNIYEGRKMIEAARKYKRMVQVGSQSRSIGYVRRAMELLAQGAIGKVYEAKGLCFNPRDSIGHTPDQPVPPGVDWNLFLGPAPMRPFSRNRFHYNWHWFWDTGNGDIGNQGIHEMDKARWGLNRGLPKHVSATGGKFVFKDDQETPNTQLAALDYGDSQITFDVRGLITPWEGDVRRGNQCVGNVFFGSEGYLDSRRRGIPRLQGPQTRTGDGGEGCPRQRKRRPHGEFPGRLPQPQPRRPARGYRDRGHLRRARAFRQHQLSSRQTVDDGSVRMGYRQRPRSGAPAHAALSGTLRCSRKGLTGLFVPGARAIAPAHLDAEPVNQCGQEVSSVHSPGPPRLRDERQPRHSGGHPPGMERRWSLMPEIWALIKPRRWILALGLVLIAINRAAGLVLPASSKFLIDDIVGKHQVAMLVPLVSAVLAATVLQGATSFTLTQLLSKAAQRMIADLRRKVQAHVGRLPVAYYDANKTGVLVSRILTDVEGVRNLIGTGLIEFVGGLFTALIAFVVLVRISPLLTGVAIVLLAGFTLVLRRAFRTVRPIFRERGKINAEVTGRLTESLGGVRVVKGYHAEAREAKVFSDGVERLLANVIRSLTATSLLGLAATLVMGIIGALVMYIGARQMLAHALTIGGFFTFTLFLAFLVAPVFQVVGIGTQITEAIAGLDRTSEVLHERLEDADPCRTIPLGPIRGEVLFENVTFGYDADKPVLHGISFDARPGTVTALVGSSGSGKSTITGLLAGFYKPSKAGSSLTAQILRRFDWTPTARS